ncbi:MAG TPA: HAMP domain-containing sensor histidine kinase [Labilithrix sp.]|nr:HAMP domain-containing sensor histidine kinase [Labilithrix sp.]
MIRQRWFGISLGRRILLLLGSQAAAVLLLLAYVFHALSNLSDALAFSARFTIAPAEALPPMLEEISTMRRQLEVSQRTGTRPPVEEILVDLETCQRVVSQYRAEWALAGNSSREAGRLRRQLTELGQLDLIYTEDAALARIDNAIARMREKVPQLAYVSDEGTAESSARVIDEVMELSQAVRQLLDTNIRFVAVDHVAQEVYVHRMREALIGFALVAFLLAFSLGLRVHRAVGPRIAELAGKVRLFRETGEFARTSHSGGDEIAFLSNALDAGFAAIVERERERERFLAVVAHELKTPLTSIVGYVETALSNPRPELRQRALEVVRKQASRLGRLIQDLLWAASARYGQLNIRPKPVGLASVIRKALAERVGNAKRFVFEETGEVYMLADEDLLAHALWQVLAYADAGTRADDVIGVGLFLTDTRARVEVTIPTTTTSYAEIEHAFLPFASIQYEGGPVRYTVGLYLSREIARLHGGTLLLREDEGRAILDLELPV